MKLRNKKTGEMLDAVFYAPIGCYEITLWKDGDYLNPNSTHSLGVYKSLTELNENWEDYKPAEPLIKDEKVRKAVMAWAECCCIPLVKHYLNNGLSCFICNDEEDNEYCLDFTFCINNLEAEHIYSITELCGEEEE